VHAWALSKKYMMQTVFGKFPESFFVQFQQRAQVNYSQQRTSIIGHKENAIKKANTHNEYFEINMNHIKEKMKDPHDYIKLKEEPLDLVRERIERIPNHLVHLASELGTFCKTVNDEFTDFNLKLSELNEAKRRIKQLKQTNVECSDH
jgi:DNA repair ATPase RecN